KQWTSHFDPVKGEKEETPLGQQELYQNCPSYEEMLEKVPAMVMFLAKARPTYLKDAPGGAALINDAQAKSGALVFAENCAKCHSSKQPPANTPDKVAWFKEQVQKPDFLEHNFLSDDKDYPVTEVQTNAARAFHTNHKDGKIWSEAYASQ